LKLMESRQDSSLRSASSGEGQDADSSSGTMSSADLIDSPWQTSASLAFITISDMWSEVLLAAIEDNAGWVPERDNGSVSSYSRTFSWSRIPCRKGRMTVRASHDVVSSVMQSIGTPLKHLTKVTGKLLCFECRHFLFTSYATAFKATPACFSSLPCSASFRGNVRGRSKGRLGVHHCRSSTPSHSIIWLQRARFRAFAHVQEAR
jgi:hypothetical protein